MTIVLDETWQPDGHNARVHLLVADVSPLMEDPVLLAEAVTWLSPQRHTKAEACRNPRSRALSVGVALLLDHLLKEVGYRECEMRYTEGPHGKPALQWGEEEATLESFNLSHSGHMVAAALLWPSISSFPQSTSNLPPIGLDIQHQTRYRPELVRRMFNAHDREQLAVCTDEAARQKRFAQLWSRAEAFAKATGEGLRWPFPTPPTNAVFHDFAVEDYSGSLCIIL